MSLFRRWLMVFLVVALLLPAGATASGAALRVDPPPADQWLSFSGAPVDALPALMLRSANSATIALHADLPGVRAETVQVAGQRYTRLGGEGYSFGTALGQPDLPVLRREVEIPFGAAVSVDIIAADYTEHTLAELGLHRIYPLQPTPIKQPDAPEEPFRYDATFYAQADFTVAAPVSLGETYIVRGHRVQPVEVWPVAYNPSTGRVRLYHQVSFRLRLDASDMELTAALADRYASSAFEAQLSAQLLNYRQGRPAATFAQTQGHYLIIAADAYYDAMQPFVALKVNRGFEVTMTRTSEIANGTTTAGIKAYIQNAYDTWPTPPSYLLLVGDTDTIPAWSSTQSSGKYTDLYYATMDGTSDWVPDVARGRFPVRSVAQTTIMVNRALDYAGIIGDETWLKKIEFIATCDNYPVAEGSHNYAVSTHTQPHGFTGLFPNTPQLGGDKIYCVTHNGTANHIRTAANDGRWAIIFSGHGGETSWADGAVSFSQTDVRNLTYQGIYPFVISYSCVTGSFNVTESFGETWVLQENKGAIAFLGASHNTYWPEDDIMERRMFDFQFTRDGDGYYPAVAATTYYGLAQVGISYPSSARYYWEAYNIMGDPSVKIFMEPDLPDYTLEITPEAQELCVADTVTYTVQLGEVLSYPYPVTLASGPTPTGVTVQLAALEVTPPGQTLLTLTAAAAAADGTYTHIITGTAQDDNIHIATTGYTVNRAPDALTLLAPVAGETVTSLAPTFSWAAAPRATTYHLQIARDSDFTDLVFDVINITGTSYTLPSALSALQHYYWRVRALNGCGESDFSAARPFSTPVWPCVLLVDDDGGGSAQTVYLAALDALGVAYNVHTVSGSAGNGPGGNLLAQYPIVLWLTGGRYGNTLTTVDQTALGGYLDGGGSLLLSSWGVGSDLKDSAFMTNYLRATYGGDLAAGTLPLTGQGVLAGQPVTVTANSAMQVSKLAPRNGATRLYDLPVPQTSAAALGYDGAYSLAYLGFGLETVTDANARQAVLATLLEHLGPCPAGQAPTASFESNSPVVLGASVIFTNTTLSDDPEMTTYVWAFGDGEVSTQEHPMHIYSAPGEYTVWLTATNAIGSHAVSAVVEVLGSTGTLPVANFISNTPVTLGEPVLFTNTTLPGDPAATTYLWDFGDGITTTLEHPTHTYSLIGTYTVTLTAVNLVGSSVFSTTVEVVAISDEHFVYLPLVLSSQAAISTGLLFRSRSR